MAIKNTALLYENGTKKKDEEEEKKYVPAAQKAKQNISNSVATKAGVTESTLDKIEKQSTQSTKKKEASSDYTPALIKRQQEVAENTQKAKEASKEAGKQYKTEKESKTGVTTADINKARQEAKEAAQKERSVVQNLIDAAQLDQGIKTDKGITLENREAIKAQQQADNAARAKAIIDNIIYNAVNDKEIKKDVTLENREAVKAQKQEDVWKPEEDDTVTEMLFKGLGNRFRSVPGELLRSGAQAFEDLTADVVQGYEKGDEITLANRDAAKAAAIAENSAWFVDPAREKAKEVAEGSLSEGVYGMATEQIEALKAMTNNTLVKDLLTAADGGATMLGYMALPFGTKYLSAYMGAAQALDTYNSRREMGESKEEAAARGITDGAIAVAVESLSGIGKVPGLNKLDDVIEAAAGKNFLANLVAQALGESGEGFAEYVLGYVGNVMNDLAFKGEIRTNFDINEALQSAWVEGLAGGMFGAGSFGIRKISGDPNTNATLSEVASDIVAGIKGVYNLENKNATDVPKPFDGNAVTEEENLVAAKIEEIESGDISEAEKAEKMAKVAEAVADTEGLAEKDILLNEAEKFKTIHEENVENIKNKEIYPEFDFLDKADEKENALENAYDKVIQEEKGVEIPEEILLKYDNIKKDPVQKLIEVVKKYYDEAFKGKTVNVEFNNGVLVIKFENDGKKKSVGWRMNAEKAATFEYLDKMFENAKYAYSEKNRDANESTSVPAFHYFVTNAKIGEKNIPIKLQVRDIIKGETKETHYYYHNEYKKIGTSAPARTTNKIADRVAGNAVVPNDIITQKKAESNIEKGESEKVSAEVMESAKRVAQRMEEYNKNRPVKEKYVPQETEKAEPVVDVPQSKKSETFERRYKRRIENGIASVFGVTNADLKGDIRPIIDEIANDIKNNKTVTDEQIERLYKQAFDDGIITEEFPQYDSTRRYIRNTPIYVSKVDQDEFGDSKAFREFARSNFGNLKISSDPRSSHLDSFYKSLTEQAPEFFSESETDPKTQLEDIADFMQQTKKQYYGIDEVYGGEMLADYEQWAKKELRAYMEEFSKGMDAVARYERDRQIKATNKAREMDREASFDAAKAAFDDNKVFDAKKAVEKAHEHTLLSDNDKNVVKRLLEGTITEGDVIFQNAGNVEGIIEVYKAEKAYKEARAPFDRYRIAYKTALQHDAIDLTAVSDEWNDKKIGLEYSRETAERNIKDITKNDYLGGEDIIKEYFAPVHEHEAMKTKWIKEMNQRVKELDFGHMNKYERAYTQMIGENYAYIVNDKITKHDQFEHDALNERIETLLNEHGKKIDKTKCEKAAAGFMDIYKDIHEQWNDERIRRGQEPVGYIEGYFPHFTEQKPESFIQKVFALLGFDIGSSKLPTDIAGRTADRKPQSKYNPFANKRTTDVTDYDVLKGFDKYVRAVGDNIYHTEDIQKLRVLSDTIRTKYSSEETEKRIEKIRNDNNYSEEDKEVLIADVFKGAPGAYHLSNFVTWLDEYANIIAGKKSRGDREAEYQMGREIYDISKALEGRIASNMIGYNVSTPIMNLVPLFQATADLSPVDIVSSVLQTGVAAARGNSFISDNSDFITNRFGSDSVYKKNYSLFSSENIKDAVDKINDGGGLVMEYVDRIVSESLVRARYLQNIKKGLNEYEAFFEADSWAAGLIADRSLGALPNIFNVKNPVAKALTMFQVESNNQWSYILKDAGKYKWKSEGAVNTVVGQIAFWVSMAICNALAKELLGRDNVVPDPIGLTADALEKISNGEPVGDVVYDTAINVVEQTPFVGGLLGGGRVPLSAALPDAEQVSKLFNPEISGNKKGQILLEEIAKPLSYILAPSGAGQLWKTGKGIEQLVKGGAFGMDNDGKEYLKFAQEYDPESIIKTLLFGQYASDAGQGYIDSGFKNKLTAKQTEQMRTAESMGLFTKDEFYDTILGLKGYDKKSEKQQAILENENLTAGQKMGLDYILFGDRNKPWDLRDYSSEEAFYASGLSESEKRLYDAEYSREEIETIEKAFKHDRTKAESIDYVAKKLGLSEAEAFKAVQIRSGKWDFELSEEDAARAAGAKDFYNLSEEDYLNILNYSKMGMEVTNEEGEKEYKSDKKYAVQNIAKLYNCSTEFAERLYEQVNNFEYSRDDLEKETLNDLINGGRYGIEDKGFFVARNVVKNAEGTKDEYGNTVSGSTKEAAVKEIKKQLNCSEEEATIYYLAASGGLVYSKNDLTTAQRKDLEDAVKQGWDERAFLDAINVIKVTGANSKDEIFKALQDAGATYAMAQGFYNLSQNKDYDRQVYFAYGMTNKKQEEKGNYFIKNFGGTAELVTAMYKAGKGKSKKQEYLDAYMNAGATYNQALEFYNLMQGNNKTFNAWYKENYS